MVDLTKDVYECGGDCLACGTRCENINKGGFGERLVLTKKKLSTKYVPPDTTLLKMIWQEEKVASGGGDVAKKDEFELKKLEQDLIKEYFGENF